MGDIMAAVYCSPPEQDTTQEALFICSSLVLQAPGPQTEHELPSHLLEGEHKRELPETGAEEPKAGLLLNILITNMEKLASEVRVRADTVAITMTKQITGSQ